MPQSKNPVIKSQPNSVTPEKTRQHAEILSNRVLKRYNHMRKRFARQRIECFRLYDWDIPEVRAVVDWYSGHLVVGEYVRWQTGPQWLPQMAAAVAAVLGVPSENLHVRRRRTGTAAGQPRYRKMGRRGECLKVWERDLQFLIDLDGFLDTGLFPDHRETRVMIRDLAKGKDFLNLYGYTGTFSCAAALGGAGSTVTVDRSATYLKWARDNFELNGLWGPQHVLVQSDVEKYLDKTTRSGRRFTLAFVDPPSFFRDRSRGTVFDINRAHPGLLEKVLQVMAPGSLLFFSTNHQRFEPRLDGLPVKDLKELTPKTIPEDYRNRHVHRCWQMTALEKR
ncbi:MAG: class I SAM-dependent methyltransferase [Candidatus Omnitrophota bacterium]|jgi:23S rRNA G2069 N7-methylase RlmK/C1962 C5-methylase RlmI